MPSTYSTNLALELMTNGEDNGTWGTITNTNLGTLLEQSIVSTGTVAMADANQTIAMTNGASATARCLVINCTGALTAQRNLVVPTVSKPYIVVNSTTGGFGIQVKTTAGTGIIVQNGKRRFLYADGTNVVEMIDSIASLYVPGTLNVDGFTLIPGGNIGTGGAFTTAAAFTQAGAFATTLTSTGATNVTLPTTGTLATLGGVETLTNKTLTSPTINAPTITTPTLGVATVTTINKVTITAPATGATLTLVDGTTVTGPPASGTMATLAGAETLTNKTLTTAALGSSTATTQSASDNSTKVATTAYVDNATSGGGIPAGVLAPYAGSAAPSGWLLAFGQSVLRTDFAALFTAIGTTYGSVDGTHFTLPDLRGRVVAGADNMGGSAANRLGSGATGGITGAATPAAAGGEQSHTMTAAEMFAHTHGAGAYGFATGDDGAGGPVVSKTSSVATGSQAITSTSGSTGSSTAFNVVQPTIVMNWIIKT